MYSMVLMAALSTSGDVPAFGRGGCRGGWGGCYGCCGCWGGGWGCWGGCYGCYGCYGCWGGGYAYGGWGSGYGYGYAYTAPVYSAPVVMTAFAPRIEPMMAALPPDAARIVVDLPTDAKLFVDGQPTKSTASRRVLQSPRLEPGNRYSYLLRAELERDGRRYQQTKKIAVRAGQEATALFSEPGILQTAQARN
jgi:uncharacterized protein (TIGR03000 family)